MDTESRNKIVVVVALLLFAQAVIRIPAAEGYFRYSFQLISEMAVIAGLAFVLGHFVNLWVGLFVGLALFSSLFPVFDRAAYMARNAIVFHAVWILIVCIAYNKGDSWTFFNAICAIALANVLFAVTQACGYDPYRIASLGVIKMSVNGELYSGLMANPNELSALLAISAPAFLRKWWCLLLPFVFAGLVIADSTGGVMALGGGLVFYSLIKFGGMRLKHVSGLLPSS